MKRIAGLIALALVFSFGTPAVFAADQSMQGEKKKTDKQQQKAPGAGPMGEMEKGGSGPSGPQTKAPAKAPGLEGAGEKKPGQGSGQ
jgi:hypothetical protein